MYTGKQFNDQSDLPDTGCYFVSLVLKKCCTVERMLACVCVCVCVCACECIRACVSNFTVNVCVCVT